MTTDTEFDDSPGIELDASTGHQLGWPHLAKNGACLCECERCSDEGICVCESCKSQVHFHSFSCGKAKRQRRVEMSLLGSESELL
jgi:hypothetical protein